MLSEEKILGLGPSPDASPLRVTMKKAQVASRIQVRGHGIAKG